MNEWVGGAKRERLRNARRAPILGRVRRLRPVESLDGPMYRVRKLIREIHRRSVWQVLGVYLTMSWLVFSLVRLLTNLAGLPDWTPTMALALLLIGLPIVTATAFIQSGVPGLTADPHEEIHPDDVVGKTPAEVLVVPQAHPMYASGVFTWRNSILGGVAAAALLAASVVTYLTMWALGLGPVGSLLAQGVLDEGDGVLMSDFGNRTDDVALGVAVTDAFRVDFSESRVLTLIEAATISEGLQRMGRDPGASLTPAVALALAEQEGIKATLEGEIYRERDGYVLIARLVLVSNRMLLTQFTERADGEDTLLAAIDRLSARLRERVGESLRSIRASGPLEALTTSSLEALKQYAEAVRAESDGDGIRALALLAEAITLDPAFAMAHRERGVLLRKRSAPPNEVRAAVDLAYEHRAHLTERTRLLAEASYHATVILDGPAEERAYRQVLETYPDDATALNNLSMILGDRGEFAEAAAMLERALSTPNQTRVLYLNLIEVLLEQGLADSAQIVRQAVEQRY